MRVTRRMMKDFLWADLYGHDDLRRANAERYLALHYPYEPPCQIPRVNPLTGRAR